MPAGILFLQTTSRNGKIMTEKVDHYQIALSLNHDGKYVEAMAEYQKEIETNPDNLDAYIRKGMLGYKLLKKYKEAHFDFSAVIEKEPDHAEALLQRGIVRCHLLRFQEALEDFNHCIRLNPNDERAFFNRGKNKFVLKYDKEEVCSDLVKAIKLGAIQAIEMLKLFYKMDEVELKERTAG